MTTGKDDLRRKLVGTVGFLVLLFLGYTEYRYLTTNGQTSPKPKTSRRVAPAQTHVPDVQVQSRSRKSATKSKSFVTKCQEHHNIVFIKTHKTGAHILTNIFQRFGETNNLNFVLPKMYPGEDWESDMLGWPEHFNGAHIEQMEEDKQQFNILCNYARYSKTMRSIMPQNTKYFTILSDPASQTYIMYHALGLNSKDYGISFDDFIHKYQYMLTRYRGGEPINVLTKNSQAFDLGLNNDLDVIKDLPKIKEYIKNIEQQFELVMISEYLEESLVLLAKRLCWTLEHVVFLPLRRFKPKDPSTLGEYIKQRARQHSSTDWTLYNHFNQTLWKEIAEYGPSFQEDLQTIRHKISIATKLCIEPATMVNKVFTEGIDLDSVESDFHNLVLKTSLKSKTYDYCLKLALSNRGYTDRIRRQSQIKNDIS